MAYTLKNEAGMCPRVTLTVQLEKLDFQASTWFQKLSIITRQYNLMFVTFTWSKEDHFTSSMLENSKIHKCYTGTSWLQKMV